jgi:hypothetical protein
MGLSTFTSWDFFAGYLRLDMNYPMKLLVVYHEISHALSPGVTPLKSCLFLGKITGFPMVSCFFHHITILSRVYHYYHFCIMIWWYIYINNYILELSENHHTIFYNSYITILLYNYFITMISLWNSSATESSTIGGHFMIPLPWPQILGSPSRSLANDASLSQ